jgi:SPP1 family predicted phage head-tail adaptor
VKAGQLDRRVELQHRALTKEPTHGEDVVSYSTYATVWARKVDLRGREYFAAQQMNSEITTEWTIRFRSDVLVTDRIVFDDVAYSIRQVAEIPRRKGLSLMATAVQP